MKICPKCGSNKVISFTADDDLCEKCREYFTAVEDIKPEWKTICENCARKHKIMDAWYKAEHKVFSNEGADSLCDICGKENGGSVMQILIRRIKS